MTAISNWTVVQHCRATVRRTFLVKAETAEEAAELAAEGEGEVWAQDVDVDVDEVEIQEEPRQLPT